MKSRRSSVGRAMLKCIGRWFESNLYFFSKGGIKMGLAKLDAYDYMLLPGVIRIHVSGTRDPDLVDILSEINRYEGRIYVEGQRFKYLDNYRLVGDSGDAYMELDVIEVA